MVFPKIHIPGFICLPEKSDAEGLRDKISDKISEKIPSMSGLSKQI